MRAFPYSTLATLIFFVIGYMTGAWNVAWLIFLTIPIYNSLAPRRRKEQAPARENLEKSTDSSDWSDF